MLSYAFLCGQILAKYKAIQTGGLVMQKHLESSLKVLKVNKAAPAWRSYVDYVNQVTIDGLVQAILASMTFLRDQINPVYLNQNDVNPLLEISLRLAPPENDVNPLLEISLGLAPPEKY
ncbi:hypothetical protein T484DRAFT_1851756 [Baffinella frigidus]|nr:hypothetical protein T484DRAFT_1851756 [Cryptophyta sp. CCMP2293]